MNSSSHAPIQIATNNSIGFTISAAAKPENAADCASNLTGTLRFLRESPLVKSVEFVETKGGCFHRFSVRAHAPQLYETTPDIPDSLARDIQARSNGQFASFDFRHIPEAQNVAAKPAPFWKRWTLSMIAVYPTLIVLFYLLRSVTANLPVPVSLFVVAFLLTGLNTRYIMPFLSKRLQGWLTR